MSKVQCPITNQENLLMHGNCSAPKTLNSFLNPFTIDYFLQKFNVDLNIIDEGLPLIESSYTSSLSSAKLMCHRKTRKEIVDLCIFSEAYLKILIIFFPNKPKTADLSLCGNC